MSTIRGTTPHGLQRRVKTSASDGFSWSKYVHTSPEPSSSAARASTSPAAITSVG